jgi:hypothetical protein
MATAESSPAKLAVMNEREIYDLTGDVKKDLLNYLDNITSDGDFATTQSIPRLPVNPEIRLLGSESQEEVDIGVPLGLQDAQTLINASRQATFGRGNQTIVDTSIHRTWELTPRYFSLGENGSPMLIP